MTDETTGIYVGKFWPFHKGHELVVRTAVEGVDTLHVVLCISQRYDIPAFDRLQWLVIILEDLIVAERVKLHLFDQDASGLADIDSRGWAKAMVKLLGLSPDVVYSSENYGEQFAYHLCAVNVLVDKARETVPCSGTEIRKDPAAHAQYLDPIVRVYYGV